MRLGDSFSSVSLGVRVVLFTLHSSSHLDSVQLLFEEFEFALKNEKIVKLKFENNLLGVVR